MLDNNAEFRGRRAGGGGGRKKGPGSRGGKYWINAKGNVEYGPPPKGVKARTPQQWQAHINGQARKELAGVSTAADLKKMASAGWEVGVDGPNENTQDGYNHFGSGAAGHAAALAAANEAAAQHKDITYAIVKVDGNYVLAGKSTSDLLKASPDKASGPGSGTTTSVTGKTSSKIKEANVA